VLFLDEPTTGLDPPQRLRMIALIQEIRDRGDLHLISPRTSCATSKSAADEVLILRTATSPPSVIWRKSAAPTTLPGTGNTAARVCDGAFVEAHREARLRNRHRSSGRLKLVPTRQPGIVHAELYQIASDQNVQIRRLSHKRDSLEDIFIKAMETADGSL